MNFAIFIFVLLLLMVGGYLYISFPTSKEPTKRELEWMVFWLTLGFEKRAETHLKQSIKLRTDAILQENR